MTGPDLDTIIAAQAKVASDLIKTPVLPLASARWDGVLPDCASVTLKLELFQQAGSFKARGALLGSGRKRWQSRARGVLGGAGCRCGCFDHNAESH